jgi:hypothetical protein
MPDQPRPFTIEEFKDTDSSYLPGMNAWLLQVFPEYAPPRFSQLLEFGRLLEGKYES